MTFLKKINRLPWKYVTGINISLVALAITFTSIASVDKDTEHRSQAKEALPTPLFAVTVDQLNPPELLAPEPSWAKVGDAILIKGKNLGNIPFGTIKLGDVIIPHDHLIAWEPTQIVFTVPAGTSTASVSITVITTEGTSITLTSLKPLTITTTNQN